MCERMLTMLAQRHKTARNLTSYLDRLAVVVDPILIHDALVVLEADGALQAGAELRGGPVIGELPLGQLSSQFAKP